MQTLSRSKIEPIIYIDRLSGRKEIEKVYGASAIKLLYGRSFFSSCLRYLCSCLPLSSFLYGLWQKMPWTRFQIPPFIKDYGVDASEFLKPVKKFTSFNDFFIRKLKPAARPCAHSSAVIPADGRYWFYEDISKTSGFVVKGKKFDLNRLLQDDALAEQYHHGSMVMARLCPSDYHRFHFPCDGTPEKSVLINGCLYSVNPYAIKQNIDIFTENKRMICKFQSPEFGQILYIDIGATNVGSINQTYSPDSPIKKGAEKGYFSFGGSALILLFEPERIRFDQELLKASAEGYEIFCKFGQSLGG